MQLNCKTFGHVNLSEDRYTRSRREAYTVRHDNGGRWAINHVKPSAESDTVYCLAFDRLVSLSGHGEKGEQEQLPFLSLFSSNMLPSNRWRAT